MTHPIRILIADDHVMVRHALSQICTTEPDMQVIGQAANGQEAYCLALLLQPDVLVMDLAMPLIDGVQVARHLLMDNPSIKIVMLTVCCEERYVLEALKAGARAYVLKDAETNTLLQAIRAVAAGEWKIDALVARTLLNEYRHQQTDPVVSSGLTHLGALDLKLLQLIARGYDQHAIGSELDLPEMLLRQRLAVIMTSFQDGTLN